MGEGQSSIGFLSGIAGLSFILFGTMRLAPDGMMTGSVAARESSWFGEPILQRRMDRVAPPSSVGRSMRPVPAREDAMAPRRARPDAFERKRAGLKARQQEELPTLQDARMRSNSIEQRRPVPVPSRSSNSLFRRLLDRLWLGARPGPLYWRTLPGHAEAGAGVGLAVGFGMEALSPAAIEESVATAGPIAATAQVIRSVFVIAMLCSLLGAAVWAYRRLPRGG
jgi:hypothetical protein